MASGSTPEGHHKCKEAVVSALVEGCLGCMSYLDDVFQWSRKPRYHAASVLHQKGGREYRIIETHIDGDDISGIHGS